MIDVIMLYTNKAVSYGHITYKISPHLPLPKGGNVPQGIGEIL
jgi:hypothetical protein